MRKDSGEFAMKGRVLQVEIPLNEMNKDMEAQKKSSLGPQRRKHIGKWHERELKRMRGTRAGIRRSYNDNNNYY